MPPNGTTIKKIKIKRNEDNVDSVKERNAKGLIYVVSGHNIQQEDALKTNKMCHFIKPFQTALPIPIIIRDKMLAGERKWSDCSYWVVCQSSSSC